MSAGEHGAELARVIAEATGAPRSPVTDARGVGGGCIGDARRVTLADGRVFFVKRYGPGGSSAEQLACEAAGLRALGAVGALRVPEVVAQTESVLVLEHIDLGRPRPGYSRGFGRALAELHRAGRGERFGFEHDNFIGATRQLNGWHDHWPTFFAERRIGFQLDLARENRLSDRALDEAGAALLEALPAIIGEPDEPPCLLHGDLWGGNALCDSDGQPVLIDPAVYYGRREAELGMTRLFGGFDADFYAGYEEVWPLAPGSERRLAVYELYHLLNHLNLFGRSYAGSSLAAMRRALG